MRFGFVHRVMTDALAALGVLALVLSGQFSRTVSAIILVGLCASLAVRESWQRHPALRHLDTGALLVVLAVQIGRVLTDVPVLDVLIEFAAALQIIRLATRKGAAHDQQVIVLALLHLIAGTVIGGGLGYGLCFLGFLVIAPGVDVVLAVLRETHQNRSLLRRSIDISRNVFDVEISRTMIDHQPGAVGDITMGVQVNPHTAT